MGRNLSRLVPPCGLPTPLVYLFCSSPLTTDAPPALLSRPCSTRTDAPPPFLSRPCSARTDAPPPFLSHGRAHAPSPPSSCHLIPVEPNDSSDIAASRDGGAADPGSRGTTTRRILCCKPAPASADPTKVMASTSTSRDASSDGGATMEGRCYGELTTMLSSATQDATGDNGVCF